MVSDTDRQVADAGVRGTAVAGSVAESFAEDGFAVLPDALSMVEVEELRTEAARICRGELGEIRGVEPADPQESDDDVLSRYLCIHFPHKISAVMRRYLAHPAITRALVDIIGPNVKAMQSMLFMKAAGKPGQAWHQDEYFIPTRDRSLAAAWIALDDATVENGCLWVLPGSHTGVIYPQRAHNDPRFDVAGESYQFPYEDEDSVPVEVAAGSVVLFDGYLLHRSLPNRAPSGFRRALVNHYMSAESLLPWFKPDEGVHTGLHDFRDIVMVAGTDPYPWKPIEDLVVPHVRPVPDRTSTTD